MLLKKKKPKFEIFIFTILNSRNKKLFVILGICIALIISILMLSNKIVLAKMLPNKSANTFSIYVDTPTGSSIEETKKVSQCLADYLAKEKEITDIEIFLGMGAPLDYAGLVKGSGMKQGEEYAELVVNLADSKQRKEKSFIMVQRLRPLLEKECAHLVENTTIKFIEMPSGPPTMADIVVEVYGENNPMKLRNIADDIKQILAGTDGLVDVDVIDDDIYDVYQLIPIKEKISRSGLTVEQINKILYLAFEGMGIAVKDTIKFNNQIGIFLRLGNESKNIKINSLESLRAKLSSLNLMNIYGQMVPLIEVVSVEKSQSNKKIYHKNLKNMINVLATTNMVSQVYPLLDSREKMLEYFTKDYIVKKEKGINTYMFDIHLIDKKTKDKFLVRFDGEMKVTLDTFRDLGGAFIAALVLIFLLLVIYYKSFVLSSIILVGSFLSIIGVIFGHLIADMVTKETFFLTATSLIGFIALMGISSRNSLLLIDFTNILIKEGFEKRRAIAISSNTRAKPIMLTAIAIILGSALLASDPIFGGLGVALISGTIAAVIISLVFVPILLDNTKAI